MAGETWAVEVAARRYARTVCLDFPGRDDVLYSDNFFDLRPGEKREIRVESPVPLNRKDLTVGHWGTQW